MTKSSRRQFLLRTVTTTAVLAFQVGGLASLLTTNAAHAAPGKPETTSATLGFIALTDAAPLIVAKEKGFFAKQGMTGVELKNKPPGRSPATTSSLGAPEEGLMGHTCSARWPTC